MQLRCRPQEPRLQFSERLTTIFYRLLTPTKMTEIPNATSVLPGALVQSLATATSDHGLRLQVLGYFDGTIDLHSHKRSFGDVQSRTKVKARVLYELLAASSPKFALSLADHALALRTKQAEGSRISESERSGYCGGRRC